ncbi:MAG: LptF/LptG family permease [Bacteroidales bacterium]|nr:LptF/LptG family permease [Bacteroidales bacterium]
MIDIRPKKLDYYIMKKFILTFFMALVLIIGIVIIFDISEKIDDFVAKNAPLKLIVFDYYLNFVPYYVNMFSPLFVFITVIFFTSRMAANSEIVAILSCGISYHRMMVPYIASAALIAMLSLGLNLYVIPKSNEIRVNFEREYLKNGKKSDKQIDNLHYQIAPGIFVYVQDFNRWNKTAHDFTLEHVVDNKLVSKTTAETAQWDSTKQAWRLKNYFTRTYTDGLENYIEKGALKDTVIDLSIKDFYMNKKTVQTLSQRDLNDLIRIQKMRGDASVMYSQIELHTRFALPFSAFILTIMGVSLSSRKKRGGIGLNIGVGIALSFSYILFLKFSEMFVLTNTLPASIALWVPNILFAFIAAFLYRRAPK